MAMSGTRKAVFIFGGIFAALIFVTAIGALLIWMALFYKADPPIRDNSVLVLRVAGTLPDYSPDDPFKKVFGGPDQSLTGLVMQFKKAKLDKRIKAILLDVNMSAVGWGKADEIRDAITDFRSSGKQVYAYIEFGLNKEYYIATAADKIIVPPPGELFINGLAADVMFFRGSLDKLGIYPDIYQIGKYKTAANMFKEKEMTEAHREFINEFIEDLYQRYINTIAQARRKTPDEVRTVIDNATYNAEQAKNAGLIDDAMYRDHLENMLKKQLRQKEPDPLIAVRAHDYRDVSPESLGLNKGERIAVIYATGEIGSGSSQNSPNGDQSIGSDTVAKALNDAAADKTIKAVVLRVDSPGGSGLASDIIWRAVETANQKKPVVVSMSDVAASGGYYISASASKIIAQPTTITGSIGVLAGKPVMRGFYDWLGISNEYVMRGKTAGMFRATEKFSDDERVKFEEWIKTTYYRDFVPKVAKGRGKDPGYIDSVAQGRVWTGGQAKDKGLVDEFGGLDKAIDVAKQLAKIPADKGVQRVILPYPTTFLQQLFYGGENSNTKFEQQQIGRASWRRNV